MAMSFTSREQTRSAVQPDPRSRCRAVHVIEALMMKMVIVVVFGFVGAMIFGLL
jgi:hypothetical protein